MFLLQAKYVPALTGKSTRGKKEKMLLYNKFCNLDCLYGAFTKEFRLLHDIFCLFIFLKEKALFGTLTEKENDLFISLKDKWFVQFEKTVKLLQALERKKFSRFLKTSVTSYRQNLFYNKVASMFYQVDFINGSIEDHFIYRRQVYKKKQRGNVKRLEVAVLYLLKSFCVSGTTREKPLITEYYMSIFYDLIMLQRKKHAASLNYVSSMNINDFALRHSKNSGMAYKLTYNKLHNKQLKLLEKLKEHRKTKKFLLGGCRYDRCEFLYAVEILLNIINSRPS